MSETDQHNPNHVPTAEIAAAGGLAIRGDLIDHPESQWRVKPGAELTPVIDGVFLGNNGQGRFTDSSVTPLPAAGIGFEVAQNSFGVTSIAAVPMEGYTVEAARLSDDGGIEWKARESWQDGVKVAVDWPDAEQADRRPSQHFFGDAYGNEGIRWGVVKVTDKDQGSRMFALAAEFAGEADHWNVKGGYVEVEPIEPAAIDGAVSSLQLPPADS